MKLSRKSDYALRAVRFCSRLPKDTVGTIDQIAESENIPREFLAKILKDLTSAGILVSHRGVYGGYAMAKKPRETTFLEVIEAADGPIHLNLCTTPDRCCDSQYRTCEMRKFWETYEVRFKKTLDREHFGKYS
jgi:Rrf2 family protein